jgi:hypothetical protein
MRFASSLLDCIHHYLIGAIQLFFRAVLVGSWTSDLASKDNRRTKAKGEVDGGI